MFEHKVARKFLSDVYFIAFWYCSIALISFPALKNYAPLFLYSCAFSRFSSMSSSSSSSTAASSNLTSSPSYTLLSFFYYRYC